MPCFVFIKSKSESLKAFQWVPRFVLHYARYKILIASIAIWFCYLKTVLIVLYLLPQILPPPLRLFFSWGKLYWHIVKTRFPATHLWRVITSHTHRVSRTWEESFPLKCFLTTLFAIPRSSKKKTKSKNLHAEFLWICIAIEHIST